MTTTPASPAASQQAAVDAALLILERMGLSPDDLAAVPRQRPTVPTFANYVPVVSAAVTGGTRRAYGSYWNRVTDQWGARRLDEPTPSEIRQLVAHVKAHVVPRRNARGGRGAAENLIAALRCLYRHAEDDGLIDERDNPARKTPQGFDLSNRVHPGLFAMKSCQGTLTLPAGHVPDGPAVRGRGSLSSGHAALSASGVSARWDHAVASSYSRPVFRHPCRMPTRRLATRRIASSWPVSRARRSS